MSLLALGLNHTTAPVEIRERVVFEPASLGRALSDLVNLPHVREAAIVSTCNRTELYCSVDSPADDTIAQWFHDWHGIAPDRVAPCLYHYQDREAIRHLLRVASGLDSMILGEPQITGQLKSSWRAAVDHASVGAELGKLFQHAFAVSKKVRSDTGIGTSPVSVAFAAVRLARQIFGEFGNLTALMIGAGETVELAARHLHAGGIGRLIVANRDAHRAAELAARFDGQGIPLAELHDYLHKADVIVSSTASSLPILGKGAVEQALKKRRHRPMFMVDIAVPRDIEPEIGRLNDVFLYTVDDLRGVVEEGMAARRAAAAEAEEIIEHEVDAFLDWLRTRDAVDTIRAFRQRAESLRAISLDQAARLLKQGHDPERVMDLLAHRLTRRLIHHPTMALRQAGRESRHDFLADARELFNLDEGESE